MKKVKNKFWFRHTEKGGGSAVKEDSDQNIPVNFEKCSGYSPPPPSPLPPHTHPDSFDITVDFG